MSSTIQIVVKVGLKWICKKEYLEDGKNDEQLDQDDLPKGSSQFHAPETVNVEFEQRIKHETTKGD